MKHYVALLLLSCLAPAVLAESPIIDNVRKIILYEKGVTLLCWRVTLTDGTSGNDAAWPSVCVPAIHQRLCTETPGALDCWSAPGGSQAVQRDEDDSI